jgi:hypothetical protein
LLTGGAWIEVDRQEKGGSVSLGFIRALNCFIGFWHVQVEPGIVDIAAKLGMVEIDEYVSEGSLL